MAIVTEDGTGKADAETYVSLSAATTYHANRGNAAWANLASDAVREQCLRKATDYMLSVYRDRWAGYRNTVTQALDWPRSDVQMRDGPGRASFSYGSPSYYPNNTVPAAVANACAELALRAATGPLIPDEGQMVKRQKVGPVEVEFQDYSRATKTYRAIDTLLAPLLAAGGGLRVIRA
jgi:hypothetical protein